MVAVPAQGKATTLHLTWPPGLRPRHVEDLRGQQRQWIYTWVGVIFGSVLLAIAIGAAATLGWNHASTYINLGVAALLFLVLLPAALAGVSRTLGGLLSLTVAVSSGWLLLVDPTMPQAAGGLASIIVLASLTESPRWTVLTALTQSIAVVVPMIVHWEHRFLLAAHLGTVVVVGSLGLITALSSQGVLLDLQSTIRRNDELHTTLATSRDELESKVAARTRDLAAQTQELERIRRSVKDSLAEQEALANRLEHLSRIDELTGLANRRGLIQALGDATHHEGWLLIADIDHFKRVNDELGHNAGDTVLAEVARLLRVCAPDGATVARVGGEEFAVYVPQTDRVAVDLLGRRLLDAVRTRDWAGVDPRLHRLTVSLGGAPVGPDSLSTTAAMRVADDALYQAKAQGRDQAVLRNG